MRKLPYWLLLTILVLGCTAPTESTVRMVVSTGLGETVLLDTEISAAGNTIDFLASAAEIETTYGGKFVDSINGISTTQDHAWFYYVNGELMGRGAASYIPEDGDIIQWDYHDYSDNPFEPRTLSPP